MTKITVLLYSERCKCHSKILQKEKIESDKIGKQGCGTWRKKYTKCAFSAKSVLFGIVATPFIWYVRLKQLRCLDHKMTITYIYKCQ